MLWGEIKNSALANLDLTEDEATEQKLIGNFYLWANEVITQVSSTIKPKYCFEYVDVYTEYDRWLELSKKSNVYLDKIPVYNPEEEYTDNEEEYWKEWLNTVFVNKVYVMKAKDFISFGGDIPLVKRTVNCYGKLDTKQEEAHDIDFIYRGYKQLLFLLPGEYSIPYHARWYTFQSTMGPNGEDFDGDEYEDYDGIDDNVEIDVPRDILECIPLYIAMKGWKIDDEYKSSVFRNEYETALARINDEHFEQNRTFDIGGNW